MFAQCLYTHRYTTRAELFSKLGSSKHNLVSQKSMSLYTTHNRAAVLHCLLGDSCDGGGGGEMMSID